MVQSAQAGNNVEYTELFESSYRTVSVNGPLDGGEFQTLTTAQQLALSVLLGEDVPLAVLLSACEDAGVFADGLAGEIAEKALPGGKPEEATCKWCKPNA